MNISWKDAKDTEEKLFRAIRILFGNNPKLLSFLFDRDQPRLKKRPGLLRDDSWTLGEQEQLLIRAALDIWSGSGYLQLWEILENWDSNTWAKFIMAVMLLKDINPNRLS